MFVVHLRDELFPRHAGPPLLRRLERHHRFEHRERRGIGRRLGLAGLAEDALRPRATCRSIRSWICRILVASVMDMPGTAVGMKRMSPSLSGGMNSLPSFLNGIDRRAHDEERHDEREPAEAQHEIDERLVNPDEEAVDRVLRFRRDFAADEQQHQHRHERDAEQRGEKHREGLRERERLEQPALLALRARTPE